MREPVAGRRLVAIVALMSACAAPSRSQQHLRTAVDSQYEALNRCYARTLAKRPDATGTMTVTVYVPATGEVDRVTIESRELVSKKLQTCVRNTLVGMRIARPDDALAVQYTLRFEPAMSVDDLR